MFDFSYNMKLHSYLEQVVGNKTAITLVRALLTYRGKVFTVRGLAETTGVSPSEASLVVKHLEEAGVLRLQPVGRSFLITLNEQSFILRRIMKPIINAENETMNELIKLLRECFKGRGNKISSVYLFGSVATEEEKKDSDIDILIISSDFELATVVVSRAREKVAEVFNKELSPLIFSESEFLGKMKQKSKLVETIRSNHILVSGKDLFAR